MEASEYKRLDQIDHILQRPSTYVGSLDKVLQTVWTLQEGKATQLEVEYPTALENLVVEVATNCADNVPRSREKGIAPGQIVQTVNERVVSMYNEGVGIPVTIHPTEKVYVPELIFFTLLTSSNYDDSKERTWAGQNGIGVKAAFIFSQWAEIECADPQAGLVYKQRCEDNMHTILKAEITPYSGKIAYTRVTFEADFTRFGVTGYSSEMIRMFAFQAAAMAFNTGVPVSFNGSMMHYQDIQAYAALFTTDAKNHLFHSQAGLQLALLDTPEQGFQVSFVNGMFTKRGGVHVNDTLNRFCSGILEKLNKKKKLFTVADVKKHLSLIISCTVVNPVFTTQSKEQLARPTPKIELEDKILKKVEKWDFGRQLALYADVKLAKEADKADKRGNSRQPVIEGAFDANDAGGPRSAECTLILCEGESAKNFGLRYRDQFKNGTDLFGVMALRGKGLNVLTATALQLMNNKELKNIRKLLGIKKEVDYSSPEARKTLRYGEVRYATDADADGIHIRALEISKFFHQHRELLEGEQPLVLGGLMTPILKAVKGKKKEYFFTRQAHEEWLASLEEKDRKTWKAQYYKGLGQWEKEDFEDIAKFVRLQYQFDPAAATNLKLAFEKDQTDARKHWVCNVNLPAPSYTPTSDGGFVQEVSNMIHSELVVFSQGDNARSIPSMVDSFKPSQRKIFYATRKKKLGEEPLKIAQFMGYCAEQTSYYNGEQNLEKTIMHMCQDFPGANNIPLIRGRGEYGTRLEGGKDHASSRYVKMSANSLMEYVIRVEDDLILEYELNDDNEPIEPKCYYPVICLAAINGAEGIGTGFSTSVPLHNPSDVLRFQREWLVVNHPRADEVGVEYTPLLPWYRGFKGAIEQVGKQRFQSTGCFKVKGTQVEVTEIPIGTWISNYKEFVSELLVDKKIKSLKDHSGPERPHWVLNGYVGAQTAQALKLVSSISTANVVLFNEEGYITRYANIESVIDDFCRVRFDAYERRRTALITQVEEQIAAAQLKICFLEAVLTRELDLQHPEIEAQITARGFPLKFLEMTLRSITAEGKALRVKKYDALQAELADLLTQDARSLWEREMAEFETAYQRTYKV